MVSISIVDIFQIIATTRKVQCHLPVSVAFSQIRWSGFFDRYCTLPLNQISHTAPYKKQPLGQLLQGCGQPIDGAQLLKIFTGECKYTSLIIESICVVQKLESFKPSSLISMPMLLVLLKDILHCNLRFFGALSELLDPLVFAIKRFFFFFFCRNYQQFFLHFNKNDILMLI